MTVRIASISEDQLAVCIKHNLWGANNSLLSKWEKGDILIFKINDELVATAKVTGKFFLDDKTIWKNDIFYNRIPIEFTAVLSSQKRIPFNGEIKNMFLKEWGKKYGWVILNKYPLPEIIAKTILNKFSKK